MPELEDQHPDPASVPAAPPSAEHLSQALMKSLLEGSGMNDFIFRFLRDIAPCFGASRAALIDYDESADAFDLLFFCGYPDDARSELHRLLHRLDLRSALRSRAPAWGDADRVQLLVPLYFQETLEAVLLLEPGGGHDLDSPQQDACRLISRFLGLFMSSSRLPVNRGRESVTLSDLHRAREVQLTYLPSEHPAGSRFETFGHNQSSALIGGDYFDYFRPGDRILQGVIADACGHGMAAALVMSQFRGLLQAEVHGEADLLTLFNRLNRRLYSGADILQYLTSVFFEFEETEGILSYLNAGHFDPLLIHSNGTSTSLPGGGPPLGMFQESRYEVQRTKVRPGDLLLLFTDGLVELRNPRDEFLGVGRVLEAARECRERPLPELAREVLSSAARFSDREQPEDDLTLFLMRFR